MSSLFSSAGLDFVVARASLFEVAPRPSSASPGGGTEVAGGGLCNLKKRVGTQLLLTSLTIRMALVRKKGGIKQHADVVDHKW